MLCEQCQSREATVHFSAVSWPSGDITKHLCENCYPKEETERIASYTPKPKALPVIDVEHITAQDYLDVSAKAHANSADAPAYRHLSAALKTFPATRQRIATEMLTMALDSLEKGNDAWHLVGLGSCFANSVPEGKTLDFVQLLEKIFLRSFELMAQSPTGPSDHPFGLGLTIASNTLRRAAPDRFPKMLDGLKAQHKGSPPAQAVLDYLERHDAEKWGGTKRGRG